LHTRPTASAKAITNAVSVTPASSLATTIRIRRGSSVKVVIAVRWLHIAGHQHDADHREQDRGDEGCRRDEVAVCRVDVAVGRSHGQEDALGEQRRTDGDPHQPAAGAGVDGLAELDVEQTRERDAGRAGEVEGGRGGRGHAGTLVREIVALGVGGQLSTGVIVVLGIRIFSNVAAIRRHLFHA